MKDANPFKILMVDDEPNVLSGYTRTIGRLHAITVAEGGAAALSAMQSSGPFAVVITDMRMPLMSGLEFITAARATHRDSVYIMLTGNSDQQTAIDAINQGNIFRFLSKPCAPEQLDTAIKAAIRQYELVTAERVLLRDTFAGSIKLMVEALELSNPELFAFQTVVKKIQQQACIRLGIEKDWQLAVAGSLCVIGLMTLPGASAKNGLSDDLLAQAASIGARLLGYIPRIDAVVRMISQQRDPVAPLPSRLQSLSVEEYTLLGAQLLRFSVDLAREQQRLNDRSAAAKQLAQTAPYDPRLINAFTEKEELSESPAAAGARTISVFELAAGMSLAADIRKADGTLLIAKGGTVSELAITSLQNLAGHSIIGTMVAVRSTGAAARAAA